MRSRRPRRKPGPVREWLTFWLVVLVVSGIVGVISLRVGRDYFGKYLAGGVDVQQGAPRIVAQVSADPEEAARREAEAKAPKTPQVTLEDREPAASELRRIERDEADGEPQDGAQLNLKEAETQAKPAAPARPAVQPDKPAREPKRYVVTAGAYTDSGNVSRMVATLAAKGYKPYVETVTRDGQEFSRISVAVVRGRSKAEELRQELARSGIPAGIAALN